MIEVPTVLVLGAGASKPYGFPTARGLVKNIYNMLSKPDSLEFKIVSAATSKLNKDVTTFQDKLRGAGTPSVDLWLEQKDNKEFVNTGKAAIATFLLLKCEKHALLLAPPKPDEDWYQVLWEELIDGATFETFQKNDLRVVTFNYDRSFEQWLFTRMKNFYSGRAAAAKLAASIPIVHVYGSLGPLPWQEQGSGAEPIAYDLDDNLREQQRIQQRQYGNQQRYGNSDQFALQTSKENAVSYAMREIQLIFAEDDEPATTKSFNKARDLIESAQALYYLGFGFHKANITRLGIDSLLKPKKIMGTTLGLNRSGRDNLKTLHPDPIPSSDSQGFHTVFDWQHAFPPEQSSVFLKGVNFNKLDW